MVGMDQIAAYWGKARPVADGAPCHLLIWHSLDVTAVGTAYLHRAPRLMDWWKVQLGLTDEAVVLDWFGFWLALHDLGKFSLSFQGLRADVLEALQGEQPTHLGLPHVRHDSLGHEAWRSYVLALALREDWFGPQGEMLEDGFAHWIRAVTGHHGQPPLAEVRQMHLHFRPQDSAAVVAFAQTMRERFLTPGVLDWLTGQDALAFEQTSQRLSWWVAGLAVLADWMGSNADVFTYCDQPMAIDAYWQRACAQAEQALSQTGVLPLPTPARRGFGELFPIIAQPSPLQQWAATVPIDAGPQLHLLEDVTGAGKTEAAVMLTHRLMAAGAADGFFIGLPTMATANAMYGRLRNVYAQLFDGVASLALAHGRKDLVETFALSVLQPGIDEGDAGQDSATARCTQWLADHNKRALLAPAGVGTIDQALLAALQSKHQSLRLLGLFRKVLIVDEVHACDDYMQRTLETLLTLHAQAGGSALLLSATLPQRMKAQLLAAFAQGMQHTPPALTSAAYPLATSWRGGPVSEHATEAREAVRRTVAVRYEPDRLRVIAHVVTAANDGRCVGWLCNTVADALRTQAELQAHLPADRITLFHARYALGDRLDLEDAVLTQFGSASTPQDRCGRVLIATQVAEMSLDVDMDELVSDLAPIDRLLQRAGRLRRHARTAEGVRQPEGVPDARGQPCLWVHGPGWTDAPAAHWFKAALPKAAFVYPDHARLWLTAQQLQAGAFTMPDDARRLIEAVYGDAADPPDGLQSAHLRAQGEALAERAEGQVASIRVEIGYQRDGPNWLADTSAPSRLGEVSHDVVLARWEGGRVLPWRHDKAAHAWAYSTVRMAQRQIDAAVPEATPERAQAVRDAQVTMPSGGRRTVLLVFEPIDGAWVAQAMAAASPGQPARLQRWRYDVRTGLVKDATPDAVSGVAAPQK